MTKLREQPTLTQRQPLVPEPLRPRLCVFRHRRRCRVAHGRPHAVSGKDKVEQRIQQVFPALRASRAQRIKVPSESGAFVQFPGALARSVEGMNQ